MRQLQTIREMWKHPIGKITIALALLAFTITIAIAGTTIYSNIVEVNVNQYAFVVNDPPDGSVYDTYTFTGSLTLAGAGVPGKTVTLQISSDGGITWTNTGQTGTTASDGSYTINWIPSTAGTFQFRVSVNV